MSVDAVRSADRRGCATPRMGRTSLCGQRGRQGNDAHRNQRRPQEEGIAAAPLPYREDLVAFDNSAAAGVRLAGTLTLPPGAGPFPGVVLISGSGPNARDEELSGHKLALVLG